MKIAIQGLGRMGQQIAHKLVESGHQVVGLDISEEALNEAAGYGVTPASSKQAVVDAFDASEPLIVWIMIAAEIVDAQVQEWLTLLPQGSVLIDGGNSDFRVTKQRNSTLAAAGIKFIDVGTSGGVWGYQNGFSMMVGSDSADTVSSIEPVLKSLAAPEGAYHYFGPSGSGHFVKMTHNAIEYGMMESLAEGYRMLKDGPYQDLDLGAAGEVWQHHSVVTSWLNELSRDALKANPSLEGIDGYVAESGEARWTLESAEEHGIELPAIQAAFDVRIASQQGQTNFATKLLAAMRNAFGGHNLNS
jgi:6-phosphogluconate dehydrogenase